MTTLATATLLKFSSGRKKPALRMFPPVQHSSPRLILQNYRRKLYRNLPRIFHAVDGKPCVNGVSLVRVNLRAMLHSARCASLFHAPPFTYLVIAMIYLNEHTLWYYMSSPTSGAVFVPLCPSSVEISSTLANKYT